MIEQQIPVHKNDHLQGRRSLPGGGMPIKTQKFGIEGKFVNEHNLPHINSEHSVTHRTEVQTSYDHGISLPHEKYTRPADRFDPYFSGRLFIPNTEQLHNVSMSFGDKFQMSRHLRYYQNGGRFIDMHTHNAAVDNSIVKTRKHHTQQKTR